ncbi:MAG TPA: hypothetical protein VEJ17_00565 [Candidatus Nitrosotalea sp.]|nr:hypothetical protein [Candidatus Nitrosotalea sp.]
MTIELNEVSIAANRKKTQFLNPSLWTRTIAQGRLLLHTVLLFALTAGIGRAEEHPTRYPNMASLDQYLMADRNDEIALARSAAPESVAREAKVMVLTRHGYETAVEGKDGFVCVVERGWMAPFENAEFWNPKIRAPICFNPAAVRSILPVTIKRTELVLAGLSRAEIMDSIKAGQNRKQLPPFEPGAMSYMMSKRAYLTDDDGHNLCHLMIYTPLADGASWGADLPGSPVSFGGKFQGAPEPITVFLVPVSKWSDGTQAPQM